MVHFWIWVVVIDSNGLLVDFTVVIIGSEFKPEMDNPKSLMERI